MRNIENAFYIGNNRAMISLGPLTDVKYCPYNCAFCYVKSGFEKYLKLDIKDIIDFLEKNKDKYNIVYISGDTDSFAPPRTKQAIELIKRISENINVDITFTTRTVFNDENLTLLKSINDNMNNKLIASISISRLYSSSFLEPYPIPTPEARIEMLKKLKENKINTILAVRPFLPIIKSKEYIEIIERCKAYVDAVLGETWYADQNLINTVCKEYDIRNVKFTYKTMDFDNNDKIWKCFEAKEIVDAITRYCNENNIPFYMRSYPANEYIRSKY